MFQPITILMDINKQHKICAACGKKKDTPYRRDDLGGYVCLTCVETHLDKTLDECNKLKKILRLVAYHRLPLGNQVFDTLPEEVAQSVFELLK